MNRLFEIVEVRSRHLTVPLKPADNNPRRDLLSLRESANGSGSKITCIDKGLVLIGWQQTVSSEPVRRLLHQRRNPQRTLDRPGR